MLMYPSSTAAAAPLNTTLPTTVSTSGVVKLPAQSTLTSMTAPAVPTSAPNLKAATLPTNTLGEVTIQTIPSASTADLQARKISTSLVGDDVTTETILSTTDVPVSTGDVKIQTVPNPTGDVTVSTALPTTSLAARTVPPSVYQHSSRAVETSVLNSVAAPSTHVDALAVEASPAALSTGTLAPSTSIEDTPAVDTAALSAAPTAAVVQRSDSDLGIEMEVEPEVHADEHGVDAELEVEPEVEVGDSEAELEVEPEVEAGDDGVDAELEVEPELESRADVEAGCHEEGDVHANVHARWGVGPALHTTIDAVRPGATAIPPLGHGRV
ncbi:hypothetical protein L227DRAFT_392407 [Lentinus tigrinus ALCF2SS1-6]|uniref:Uncharacterized protein n=1 Tax=Lentinus tigrinus ALCF2SS1-6 TaxID=1328759 RepID=A0A5C2SIT6_9APHY|nr:hypothetical protein L227DRAFT_392407 [Lentinus tigrinus ALCF2SS1-6]